MGNGFGEKQYINFPLPLLRNLMHYKTRTLRGVIVYEALRTGKDWHVVLYEIGTTQYKELHELGCSQNELYQKYRNSMSMVLDKINSGIPAGNLNDTIAFLARLDAIKEREGIK